jgi:hypothetical protein
MEDETNQLQAVKASVQRWCKTFAKEEHVLKSRPLLEQMKQANERVRNEFRSNFEALFAEAEWQSKYTAYVRASLNQMKAAELKEYFDKMLKDKDSKTAGVFDDVQAAKLNAEYCLLLNERKDEAKEAYSNPQGAMQKVLDAARVHDTAQYNYFVVIECQNLARLGDRVDVESIQKFLKMNCAPRHESTDTPMDQRVTKDSRDPLSNYCHAFKKIKQMKKVIRAKMQELPISSSKDDMPDEVITAAKEICSRVRDKLQKQSSDDLLQKENHTHVIAALAMKPPDLSLQNIDLFRRVLMPIYTNGLKHKLRHAWSTVVERDMITEMGQLIDKDTHQARTVVNTALSQRMYIFATSNNASTFEQAIEYCTWLAWMFHQYSVKHSKPRK